MKPSEIKPSRIYNFKELVDLCDGEPVRDNERVCPYYTMDGYSIVCHLDACEYELLGTCRIDKHDGIEYDYNRRESR